MMNADEALSIILHSVAPLEPISVSLQDSLGMTLAENYSAAEDLPGFDNAGMDGYAIRSDDLSTIPVELPITGEIPAGSVFSGELQAGQAIAIMTGAKLPEGCDAVIQVEWTEKIPGQRVRILKSVAKGHNIRRAGKDIKRGALALEKGTFLRPQEIGILAALGYEFIQVHRTPEVAVLTTGDELIELNKQLRDGQIRNSNFYMLQSLIAQLGCPVIDLGIAKDEQSALKGKLRSGLLADVLITSGGVSAGNYDFVLGMMHDIGIERKFWKVNIKPGMPFMFGMYGKVPVFGLPGNPVSTFVTFIQFVKPALEAMKCKHRRPNNKVIAVMGEPYSKNDGKKHFLRGYARYTDKEWVVSIAGLQASNMLTSLVKANCLVLIPENRETVEKGESVEIEFL